MFSSVQCRMKQVSFLYFPLSFLIFLPITHFYRQSTWNIAINEFRHSKLTSSCVSCQSKELEEMCVAVMAVIVCGKSAAGLEQFLLHDMI